MTKRVYTKIGDLFEAKISDNSKRYFQYIANDLTQLNSDVIRVFRKKYSPEEKPKLESIINDEVLLYVHCVINIGIKRGCWNKVGSITDVGEISEVIFRGTSDYGGKEEHELPKYSNNWHIWRINDENYTNVGKLKGENRNSHIGLVVNYLGVMELLKGNKYPPLYPEFK